MAANDRDIVITDIDFGICSDSFEGIFALGSYNFLSIDSLW